MSPGTFACGRFSYLVRDIAVLGTIDRLLGESVQSFLRAGQSEKQTPVNLRKSKTRK